MSIVSRPARPVAPQSPPQHVRHGQASLRLRINGVAYRLRRASSIGLRREVAWELTHLSGPRAGRAHVVCRVNRTTACSCEDFNMNHAECKHIRALVAVGIFPRCSVSVPVVPAPPKSTATGGVR
jgi:hypothetical protein